MDRGLVHPQNLAGLRLRIVVLVAYDSHIRLLRLLLPELLPLLASLPPGQVVHVGLPH